MTDTYLGIDIHPTEQVVKYQDHKKEIIKIFDDFIAKSSKTEMADEAGNDCTGRVIKDSDLDEIRKKYLG